MSGLRSVALRRPTVGWTALLLLALAPVAARALDDPYLAVLATRAAILAAAAVSLQLIVGPGGLVSLGHAAFLGIGGYAALGLAVAGVNEAALSLPAAVLGAALFARATGGLALRTRGVTFIMITLAFAQMAYFIAQSLEILGGDDGAPLDPPRLFGVALAGDGVVLQALTLAVLAACRGRLPHARRLALRARAARRRRDRGADRRLRHRSAPGAAARLRAGGRRRAASPAGCSPPTPASSARR